MLIVTAVDTDSRMRLIETVTSFLQFDDDRIGTEAQEVDFPEFDYIELYSRTQF